MFRKLTNLYSLNYRISVLRLFSSESSGPGQGAKGIVVGVYDRDKNTEEDCIVLSPGAYKLDQEGGGKISSSLNGLRGDIGQLGKVTLLSNVSEEFAMVAVAGLGPKGAGFNDAEYLDEEAENVRIATGKGARALMRAGFNDVSVEDHGRAEAAAEGSALGSWFYSDKPSDLKLAQYTVEGAAADPAKQSPDEWMRGLAKADSQNLVRCLCETPANFNAPLKFAERARDLLCPYGVQVWSRDVRWLKENHMNALLTVGSSSTEQPTLLELYYCSDDPAVSPYIMIGQGTTFNSGGLCRKSCERMMEADFAGAATILGVFKAVAAMKMPINLRAFIPVYEHQLGGMAMRNWDVIETHGTLIQTPHTDDFHQVPIAETIMHVLKYHCPANLFTIGTLSPGTEAFMGATSGVWSRCDLMWAHVNYAGAVTGDRMWRMPLFGDYSRRALENKSVDITNLGKGEAGEPCLIAGFLNKITSDKVNLTHFDITGSSAVANGYVPYLKEGLFTGAPTRGIVQLLCHLDFCKKTTSDQKNKDGQPLKKITSDKVNLTHFDITGSSAVANGYVPYLKEGLFTGAPTRGIVQLLCHLDFCKKTTSDQKNKDGQPLKVATGPCT